MSPRRRAPAAGGRFPLIVYSPSINADPYENAPLFEFLASYGYVVASAPSMGADETEVRRDAAGAYAQQRDLAVVLDRASREPMVDAERVGALGFSWGGMAGLMLALEHQAIEAVACFDGAMRFPEYGAVAQAAPSWQGRRLRAALLDIALSDETRVPSLGDEARYADVYLWSQPGIRHRDFAYDSIARFRLATDDPASQDVWEVYRTLVERVKLFFDAYLKRDPRSKRALQETPSCTGAVWTIRPGDIPPPTPAQLVQIIEEDGMRSGIERIRRICDRDPGLVPFEEDRLLALAYTWGPDRATDLMPLLELTLEFYPQSAQAHYWLGQVLISLDDLDQAERMLTRATELDPDLEPAHRLLASLRDKKGPGSSPD